MQNPNQIVVVRAAIVGKGDEVLTLKRAPGRNSKTSGMWELPGGQIDPGEDPRTALIREIREETGLDIVPISPLEPFNSYTIEDGDKAGTSYQAFCCKAVVKGGTFQLSDEHVDYAHQSPSVMAQSPDFRADTPLAIRQLF